MPAKTATTPLRRAALALHVVSACGLAYYASATLVTLTSQLAHRAGMARADAVMLAAMLGFVYLWLILLWAFSRQRVRGTWGFLAGLGSLAAVAAHLLGGRS